MEEVLSTSVWLIIIVALLAVCGILIHHNYVMSGGYRAWKARRTHRKAGYPSTFLDEY